MRSDGRVGVDVLLEMAGHRGDRLGFDFCASADARRCWAFRRGRSSSTLHGHHLQGRDGAGHQRAARCIRRGTR